MSGSSSKREQGSVVGVRFRDPVKVETQALELGGFTVQGLEDESVDEVRIEGYAARYDTPFQVFSVPGYRFMRKQEPGSYQRSLSQNPKVMLRLNHEEAFANTRAGTLQLSERDDGLWFEGLVSKKNPQGLAMLVEMNRGTLTESSVAYQVVRAVYEEEELEDGSIVRTQIVQEADINRGDVSVVQFGMNPETTSGIAQGLMVAQAAGR